MNSQKGGAAAFAATRITLRPFDQALDLARCILDADARTGSPATPLMCR